MSEEILMNITPMETRVAVVENGVLQEVHIERSQSRGLVGNIYKGRVVRVLPGMQAAFVDIGLERAAFIHMGELQLPKDRQIDSISGVLHDGQTLLVQVTKDPIGSKGARLTTYFSMPSRYLVHMPSSDHTGVSLKIEDEAEPVGGLSAAARFRRGHAHLGPRRAARRAPTHPLPWRPGGRAARGLPA